MIIIPLLHRKYQMNHQSKFEQTLRCLPTIISYLTQADRVRLSAVNSLIREYLLENNCWVDIEFTDFSENQKNWKNHCEWINKYLQIIKPTKFILSIYNKHEPKEIIETLMVKEIKSIEILEIYC